MSVDCTRLLLATGAPPDPFAVLRGHSPTVIEGGLIHVLRVGVIFAFARSAMPVLQTLVRVRQLASSPRKVQWRPSQKRLSGPVVPIWVGRERRPARESQVGDFAGARVKLSLKSGTNQASGLRDQTAAGEGNCDE
jgi:hypothetical protein